MFNGLLDGQQFKYISLSAEENYDGFANFYFFFAIFLHLINKIN